MVYVYVSPYTLSRLCIAIILYNSQLHDSICICKHTFVLLNLGPPNTPVLTYKSTHNEILVSWSPVGSDRVCGPVTYNITVMPSHGMMMMINDTFYNITGLNYNTNYIITVYATNNVGHGEPVTVTVRTKDLLPTVGTYVCR